MQSIYATGFLLSNYITFFVRLSGLTFRQRSILFVAALICYLLLRHRRPNGSSFTQSGSGIPTMQQAMPSMGAAFIPVPPAQAVSRPTPTAMPHAPVAVPEMFVINQFFYEREILVAAISYAVTPDYDFYELTKDGSASWSVITEKVRKDIAFEIYRSRGKVGEAVHVEFEEMPPMLRVTRAVREVLPWSSRVTGLPAGVAQFGAKLVVNQLHPVTVDMNNAKGWFAGIFSSSGGGKSTLLHAGVLSLLETSSLEQDEFYFIDLDSAQFEPYRRLPQVKMVASTEQEALCTLLYLQRLMNENYHLDNTMRRFLIIDELQMLTEGSEVAADFIRILVDLASHWRKHGGRILVSTQDPTGDNFPKGMQVNVKAVFAGSMVDDRYMVNPLHVTGARDLRGDGDFLIRQEGGRQTNFKGFFVTKHEIDLSMKLLVKRFGEDDSLLDLRGELNRVKGEDNLSDDDLDPDDMAPVKNTKASLQQRKREIVAKIIAETKANDGVAPTQWSIREWHKKQYDGLELNSQLTKKLFALAKTQLEESDEI